MDLILPQAGEVYSTKFPSKHAPKKMKFFRQLPKLLIAAMVIGTGVYFCQAQKSAKNAAAIAKGNFREILTIDNNSIKRDSGLLKSYSDVIDRVEPAVVKISTSQEVQYMLRRSPYTTDPFLREFFGLRDEGRGQIKSRKQPLGLGSGVIVTKDGYILTNNHVIQGATEIKVTIPGRDNELDAKVIDSDPTNDVAVIKVQAEGLPIAVLADSSQVRRGDIVFAVGAPFGYDQSVSMGIVSALGRRSLGQNQEANYIQTDAAINPGNSGGPLIDAEGRVIGINTAIYSNTGSSAGIGFAIPSNRVIQIASSLVSPKGVGQSAYLGAESAAINSEMARYLKVNEGSGVHITAVTPDSPAEKAGLQVDDVILELQGRKVQDPNQMNDEISALPAGRTITLGIWRSGEHKDVQVTLGDRSKVSPNLAGKDGAADDATYGPYGLKLTDLTRGLRSQLQFNLNSDGVVVEGVKKGSPADNEGIEPGDVIYRINRYQIRSSKEAEAAFAKATEGASLIHLWRAGRTAQVVLEE